MALGSPPMVDIWMIWNAKSLTREAERYRASGGDLDALLSVTTGSAVGVDNVEDSVARIEDAPDGATRLYFAARHGWCLAVVVLLERGADVHLGWPSNGWTPLHAAASHGHLDAAVRLLDAGARVEDRGRRGATALHRAVGPAMCTLLLSRGASPDARDDDGRDPEALARSNRSTTTADLLAAVRAAGGWLPYVDAPRKELLALRQRLPALRDRGRAAPSSSVRAHERLFLDTPDDVFTSVLAFWRTDRDPRSRALPTVRWVTPVRRPPLSDF